MNFRLNYLRWH